MTIDMSQFYQVFFEEAGEHLASMESLLLALDTDNPSLDDLNAIFRAAHSIKGGSGTFGFTDMTELTHVLETLLDRLRKEELRLRPEMVDAFLAAGDLLRAQLEHHQGGPEADPGQIAEVSARLASLAADDVPERPLPGAADAALPATRRLRLECVLPADLAGDAAALENLLAALAEVAACEPRHLPTPADPRLVVGLVTSQPDTALTDLFSFYVGPDEISLHDEAAMAASGQDEGYGFFDDAPGGALAATDPGFGFFDDAPGMPGAEVPAVAAPGDDVGFGFFADAPGAPAGTPVPPEPDSAGYGFFDGAPGQPPAAPAVQEGDGYGFFHQAPGAPAASPDTQEGEGYGLFRGAPGSEHALGQGGGRSSATPAAPAAPAGVVPSPQGRRTSDNPSVETARSGRRENDKTVTAASAEASSIRVSVEKVDQLINLVGELVITQAMIADAAGYLDPMQAEKLLSGIDLLARNTRDLQESVMSIRMLPMSMVFSRFPRVIRDLAGKLSKQVELKTVGENTELDKGLIEKITDPLTHLVRNSLDHGIETPEARIAAGKPPKGTLTLKASHQGGNIVIEVLDDGAGLNRARILGKAREKGIPVHDGMSDSEVWQLIFAPGFSTAEVVTDVSGRGVGMDVVKRNIESLGGKVELESSPGVGTRTVIRLPLTLAILDGMSVGVGGETFIVPLTAIIESLQPARDNIKTMAGDSRVIHIRGEYLPIVPLAEVFGHGPVEDLVNGIIVVVEAEEGKAALFVDELLGQHQVVIKSLEANYRKVPGISGATIMGDGSVALILDVAAVTRLGLGGIRQALAA